LISTDCTSPPVPCPALTSLRTTTSPSINYNGWDADALMGCVCDEGYQGYDCSQRKCPWGLDPTSSVTPTVEEFVFRCQADAGYFSMTVLGTSLSASASFSSLFCLPLVAFDPFPPPPFLPSGRVTEPIPANATPSLLRYLLMRVPLARSVRVSTPVLPGDLQPSICGLSSPIETSIWFEDYYGARPPIRVSYGDTANTRLFPNGATSLSLSGATPILKMVTQYTLTCPQCTAGACLGSIYFNYKDSFSSSIDISATLSSSGLTPLVALQRALEDLTDFTNLYISDTSEDTDLSYEITSSTSSSSICSTTSLSSFEISILSSYGNLPKISLVDSTLVSSLLDVPLNLTFQSNHGLGTFAECSHQGICNHDTGVCSCLEEWSSSTGTAFYRALSSDGIGTSPAVGSRGDCGYLEINTDICPSIGAPSLSSSSTLNCNGHGFCAVANEPCLCYQGWYGYNCQYASCPRGRAWFDEAISLTEAHQVTSTSTSTRSECSGMGICDHTTGLCHCRKGFSGSACQYFDCPYDTSTGSSCAGNGWCVSMREFINRTSGFSYGEGSNVYGDSFGTYGSEISTRSFSYPDTWDADMIQTCLCSGHPFSASSHPLYPPVTANGILSGRPLETRNLPGYGGYSCQNHLCPYGPKVTTGRAISGDFEVQRILCLGGATSLTSFRLVLKNLWRTEAITGDMTSAEIKEIIEWIPAIGNVSVEFRNSETDGVTTACNTTLNGTHGGFYFTFYDNLEASPSSSGSESFPLLTVAEESGGAVVTVERVTSGNIEMEECGGDAAGYCDRQTGTVPSSLLPPPSISFVSAAH
jgi:hypothetical protein